MTTLTQNFNLSQRMVQELGKNIVCGEYNKKENIPTEADLCEKFGVSRSAVREAVKMLSAKGLINSTPRKGITILPESQWNIFDPDLLSWMLQSKPSMNLLKEFLQMRIAIEPEAAALAARLGDMQKIDAIEIALQRMQTAAAQSEEDLEADIAFHISILYASNNRFYIRLRDFIQTALRVSISHTSTIKGDQQSIIDDHAKVFNAIKSGNAERAKQTMTQLIDEALSFIEQELQKKN
jgi:DNA-binding FadR family transcriptional regulator